jgi:hypothetical protein
VIEALKFTWKERLYIATVIGYIFVVLSSLFFAVQAWCLFESKYYVRFFIMQCLNFSFVSILIKNPHHGFLFIC